MLSPAAHLRSTLCKIDWDWTSRPRCSEVQMDADAKNAPGSPIRRHTTATTETIILTARARMTSLPQRRSASVFEAETHPADGRDVVRVGRVVAELATQPRHVHVEGLRGAGRIRAPDLAHEGVTGDDGSSLA